MRSSLARAARRRKRPAAAVASACREMRNGVPGRREGRAGDAVEGRSVDRRRGAQAPPPAGPCLMAAWAAASRAIGTRKGEQET